MHFRKTAVIIQVSLQLDNCCSIICVVNGTRVLHCKRGYQSRTIKCPPLHLFHSHFNH